MALVDGRVAGEEMANLRYLCARLGGSSEALHALLGHMGAAGPAAMRSADDMGRRRYAWWPGIVYQADRREVEMGGVKEAGGLQSYRVSSSGQMSLPAAARRRWNLEDGGPVEVADLGYGVLTVPEGSARDLLDDLLSREQHAAFVKSLPPDSELATT